MSTPALNTRTGVGRPLTWAEGDANWSTLEIRTGNGWNDLPIEVTVQAGGPNVPSWANFRDGLWGWAFSPTTMNECWGNIHLLHDYDDAGGTTPGMVYPHIHWASNTTSTGTVRFGCEFSAARRSDAGVPGTIAYGATTIIYFDHVVGVGEQYYHQVTEPPDGSGIPLGTQLMVDAIIKCRFFRDATHINDTFPDPIFLDKIDAHCPTYRENTPNRTYPFG